MRAPKPIGPINYGPLRIRKPHTRICTPWTHYEAFGESPGTPSTRPCSYTLKRNSAPIPVILNTFKDPSSRHYRVDQGFHYIQAVTSSDSLWVPVWITPLYLTSLAIIALRTG